MSRFVSSDFESLRLFLIEYGLKDTCQNIEFLKILKSIHKSYLSLLVFYSELKINHSNDFDSEILNRMAETCSDFGNSILLTTHGMYKQASMSNRSAIENFAKSICYAHDNTVISDFSVRSVFSKTSSLSYFSDKTLNDKFNLITSIYSNLCSYTHTATITNMSHISALNDLPKFNIEKSTEISTLYKKLVKCCLYIYIRIYRGYFFKFSPDNRDIIFEIFSPKERLGIMEAEAF